MTLENRRFQFQQFLKDFTSKLNVKFTKAPPEGDSCIICTAVEDFDPESNDLWQIKGNKSFARDAHCSTCKRQVVMSDTMFAGYCSMQRTAKVMCGKCFLEDIDSGNAAVIPNTPYSVQREIQDSGEDRQS